MWRQRITARNSGDSSGFPGGGGKGPSPAYDLSFDPWERQPLDDDVTVTLLRPEGDELTEQPWMLAALLEEEEKDRANRNASHRTSHKNYKNSSSSSSSSHSRARNSSSESREILSTLSSTLLSPIWVEATVAELRLVALHVLKAAQSSVLQAPRSIQTWALPLAGTSMNGVDDEASFALPCALAPPLPHRAMCETCPCASSSRQKHERRLPGRSCPAEN